ncbi:MAG: hypothetical protein HYV14_05630 [Elusimicrobia bacterium]|nr:hypothetical protein [Elusimicrobiota bacterium]
MIPGLLLAAALAVRAEPAPQASKLPEDLGPATIDVSSYPPEQRRVYKEVFLRVYGFLDGGPARAINSPLLEIDPAGEAAERRAHPGEYSDASLVAPSRDGWRREVLRVKLRPPCCGACPVLSGEEARQLWNFLVYDSVRRKTGPAAAAWFSSRRELIRRFAAGKGGK